MSTSERTDAEVDLITADSLTYQTSPGAIVKDLRVMWPELGLPDGIQVLRESLDRLSEAGNKKAQAMRIEWHNRVTSEGRPRWQPQNES